MWYNAVESTILEEFMELLYFLEKLRTPVGDFFFQLITYFGEDVLFLALALILLWCINKKEAYYILICGFAASLAGQFMKTLFKVDRPWVKDPHFKPVESAVHAANDYSFPSGHTIIVTSTWGATALSFANQLLRIAAPIIILLVGISRMYLGVHTPWDVGVSIVIALILIFVLWPLFNEFGTRRKLMYPLMGILTAMGIGFMLYVTLYPFPADIDGGNLSHAVENAYKFLGCALGMWVIYEVDDRFIRFDTKTAVWWAQIPKLLLGLALVLGIKAAAKPLLNLLFNGHGIAHTVRYFLTVLAAGCLWPLTFKWFGKLGKK